MFVLKNWRQILTLAKYLNYSVTLVLHYRLKLEWLQNVAIWSICNSKLSLVVAKLSFSLTQNRKENVFHCADLGNAMTCHCSVILRIIRFFWSLVSSFTSHICPVEMSKNLDWSLFVVCFSHFSKISVMRWFAWIFLLSGNSQWSHLITAQNRTQIQFHYGWYITKE